MSLLNNTPIQKRSFVCELVYFSSGKYEHAIHRIVKKNQEFQGQTNPGALTQVLNFIIILQVMAIYSAKFESVCNQLQGIDINLKTVDIHIIKLICMSQFYRI